MELTNRDIERLAGVNTDLIRVFEKTAADLPADSDITFFIIEGLRTAAEETKNVANGKSQTMDSRHLYGLAVDFGINFKGVYTKESVYYSQIWDYIASAGKALNIPLEWGGNWETLHDLGHVQLPHAQYPDPAPSPDASAADACA